MAQAKPPGIPIDTRYNRKDKLFYTANALYIVEDLLRIFSKYTNNIQIFNQVVQGTPIPRHRVLFFVERTQKPTFHKWTLFFKFLLKFYNLHEIGDLLYQGFYYAGLKKDYIRIATTGGNYFLWPQGKNIINPHCELPGPLE